ncbi:MAG: flavohemoglobin expression-modulating QEGLA motif protein [Wenzhouxiangella sp.]
MSASPSIEHRITAAAQALRQAEQPLRILGLLAWPLSVRQQFLDANDREMPRVAYPPADTRAVDEALAIARPLIEQAGPAREWLSRIADRIATAARMINHLGEPAFFEASTELYGAPSLTLADSDRSPLDLARRLRRIIDGLSHIDLGAPADASATAEDVARRMQTAVSKFFGDEAPVIEVVDNLSANATAGPDRIRIRSTARFTDRDVEQLVHHEAGIHVTTGLNGRHQTALPILAASHPGTTRTQEGLAVFSEFITGCMDLDRLGRLADRVLGIQMAVDGADFLQVYRYFLDRVREAAERDTADLAMRKLAFEQARRVFRGGPLSGGAPFTKDAVYLDGLLRVHDFLRSVVAAGRADVLMLLFCGKLDLEDVPVLCELAELGLLKPPKFLPAWASDRRFLVSYLAYSGFLSRVRMGQVHERYSEVLERAPRVAFGERV